MSFDPAWIVKVKVLMEVLILMSWGPNLFECKIWSSWFLLREAYNNNRRKYKKAVSAQMESAIDILNTWPDQMDILSHLVLK